MRFTKLGQSPADKAAAFGHNSSAHLLIKAGYLDDLHHHEYLTSI